MIDEALRKIVDECCERNDVRAYDRPAVVEAVEKIWAEASLLELLRLGEMEIAGIESGQLRWKTTQHGKDKARRIIGE